MNNIEELKKEVQEIVGTSPQAMVLGQAEKPETRYAFWIKYYYNPAWVLAPGLPPLLTWVHRASDPEYCRVEKIETGKWKYGFEDGDKDVRGTPKPDNDFDEPLLIVEKVNSTIKVTVQKYGGTTRMDLGIGGTTLWTHDEDAIGKSKEVKNPPTVEVVTPPVPEKPWWERLPWWVWPSVVGIGGGTVALLILRATRRRT